MAEEFHGPGNDAIIDVSELSLRDLDLLDDSAIRQVLQDVLSGEEQNITASFGSEP